MKTLKDKLTRNQVKRIVKAARKQNIRPDLRRANLSGVGLSSIDLRDADLSGANLYRASLYKAKLNGAILNQANLRRANLLKADLRRAVLKEANLTVLPNCLEQTCKMLVCNGSTSPKQDLIRPLELKTNGS